MEYQGIIKNIGLNLDINARKRVEGSIGVDLYSRDIETGVFEFTFINEGELPIQLDESYTAKIMIKFHNDENMFFVDDMEIVENVARFVFPHSFIRIDGKVTMYIYLTKGNKTSDVAAITFDVNRSEIDKFSTEIYQVYDKNYEEVLTEFEEAINLTRDEWTDMAEKTRNFVSEIEGKTVDEFVELKMDEKYNEIEQNYITKLLKNEQDIVSTNAQLAQTTKNIETRSINVLHPPAPFIGAKGDGVTDDTKALQDLANSLNEFETLYFPASSDLYKITDTLFLKGNTNVVMDGEIGYFNSDFKTAVQYGDENTHTRGTTLKFNVRRNVISDWSDENSIGVKLINVMESNIDIERIYGFTIGFQGMGISDGFCYNNIVIKTFLDNKIHIDLTSDLRGWSNENVFIGGRFANRSTVNPEKSRYGVRLTSRDSYYQNANLFMKPSFEMNHKVLPEGQEALPVLVEYGNHNKFEFCRNEGNGKFFARHINRSANNAYSTSIGTCIVDNSESSEKLFLAESVLDLLKNKSKPIFNSGFLPSKAYLYKGSDNVTVLNNSVFKGFQDTGDERMFTKEIVKTNGYLEFTSTSGIGRKVKLGRSKRLLIKRSCISGHYGRVYLKIFDINGQQIIDTTKQRIFSDFNLRLNTSTNFGGSFNNQSDTEFDLPFTFSDDVDSVTVILAGGANRLKIKSYSIYSFDGDGSSIINFYDSAIPILPEIPSAGTWSVGDKIYFENPTSHIGAICTTAGTPGTWKMFGAITP